MAHGTPEQYKVWVAANTLKSDATVEELEKVIAYMKNLVDNFKK